MYRNPTDKKMKGNEYIPKNETQKKKWFNRKLMGGIIPKNESDNCTTFSNI